MANLKRRATLPFMLPEKAWIDAWSGWGSPHGGQFFARVHKGERPALPEPGQSI
jgi:hypothetical protein